MSVMRGPPLGRLIPLRIPASPYIAFTVWSVNADASHIVRDSGCTEQSNPLVVLCQVARKSCGELQAESRCYRFDSDTLLSPKRLFSSLSNVQFADIPRTFPSAIFVFLFRSYPVQIVSPLLQIR